MDYGFGFKNWDNARDQLNSPTSIESSPPTYSSDPYGFNPNAVKHTENYDSDSTYGYDIDDMKSNDRGSRKM